MAQPKKARLGFPFIWVILAFCLVGILALILRPGDKPSAYEEKRKAARVERLATLKKEEAELLNNYGWANKEKGIVRIPIEKAMALTVDALKSKGATATDLKAEAISTSLIPPYLQQAQPAAGEAAPAAAPAVEAAPAAAATPQAEAPADAPAATAPAAETAN